MSTIVHINARQQRKDAEKLNRSDAINRALIEANQELEQARRVISQQRVGLIMAWLVSGLAVVVMGYALLKALGGSL